eukprot:8688643-Pyramimonas_sp.AAC.1
MVDVRKAGLFARARTHLTCLRLHTSYSRRDTQPGYQTQTLSTRMRQCLWTRYTARLPNADTVDTYDARTRQCERSRRIRHSLIIRLASRPRK